MKEKYLHPEMEVIDLSSNMSICETSPVGGGLEGTGEEGFIF